MDGPAQCRCTRYLIVLCAMPVFSAAHAADGCAELATAVAAALEGVLGGRASAPRRSRATARVPASPAVAVSCGTTAAVASHAFGRSLGPHGYDVTWSGSRTGRPGDYCLSHDLDHCYPRGSAGSPHQSAANREYVDAAWRAVQAGVRRHMPFGVQSDLAWFRPADLTQTLSISLDVMLERPARHRIERDGRH